MLMLSRRAGETIVADGPVVITVMKIEGNKVRIAVEADDSVTVHRGEVLTRMQAENRNVPWVYAAAGMEAA